MKALIICLILGVYFTPSPYKQVYRSIPIDQKLMGLYEKYGVLFPKIVICQNRLETSNFNSRISIENLNQWGMKYTKTRKNAIGKQYGHAYYLTLEDGVRDYAEWQKQMIALHNKSYPKRKIDPFSTEEEYLWFLDHLFTINGKNQRYAEDLNYTQKLKTIRLKYDNIQSKRTTQDP